MKAYRVYTNANVSTASAPRIMMTLFETALRHMRAQAAYGMGDYRTGGDAPSEQPPSAGLQPRSSTRSRQPLRTARRVYSFVVGR